MVGFLGLRTVRGERSSNAKRASLGCIALGEDAKWGSGQRRSESAKIEQLGRLGDLARGLTFGRAF